MNKKLYYEIIFTILALIAVFLAIQDLTNKITILPYNKYFIIDFSIQIIFTLDYSIRFYLAKNKRQFVKSNIPDLIAIIPFSSFFKALRIIKLTRFIKLTKLIRVTAFIGRFISKCKSFFYTNGLIYVLLVTLVIIVSSAFLISPIEKITILDSLWWSFVTATTVGYGDISPTTTAGRIIAAILMLVGIGTIGMLTGTIATFFLQLEEKIKTPSELEKHINNDTELSQKQKDALITYLRFLKHNDK